MQRENAWKYIYQNMNKQLFLDCENVGNFFFSPVFATNL